MSSPPHNAFGYFKSGSPRLYYSWTTILPIQSTMSIIRQSEQPCVDNVLSAKSWAFWSSVAAAWLCCCLLSHSAKLLSSDGNVATKQSVNEIEDNNNDEQQYWESASSSFSKINNGSHAQTGVDSHPSRHSTTQQENASGANFYLSDIASVKTPQTTVDRIECLSRLFSYNGSIPLVKEMLSTRFMSSQVNSLAKSLALPVFVSKNIAAVFKLLFSYITYFFMHIYL